MPHQCTNCAYVFPDGSKEMLTGCPDCGGNKFQFHPDEVPDQSTPAEPPSREGSGLASAVGRAANTVRDLVHDDTGHDDIGSAHDDTGPAHDGTDPSRADPDAAEEFEFGAADPEVETTVDTAASTAGSTGDSTGEAAPTHDDRPSDGLDETPVDEMPLEDRAQAAARSAVVDADELPDPSQGRVIEPESDERPDLADLRAELNDQFESIRIVEPGEYELNLMELYDRNEYIIALQENGRYVIEVPDRWLDPDD